MKKPNLADLVLEHLGEQGRGYLEYAQSFVCVQEAIGKIIEEWRTVILPSISTLGDVERQISERPKRRAADNCSTYDADLEAVASEDLELIRNWKGTLTYEDPDLVAAFDSELVTSFFTQAFTNKIAYLGLNAYFNKEGVYNKPLHLLNQSTDKYHYEGYVYHYGKRIAKTGYIREKGDLKEVEVNSDDINRLMFYLGQIPLEHPLFLRLQKIREAIWLVNSEIDSLSSLLDKQARLKALQAKMRQAVDGITITL